MRNIQDSPTKQIDYRLVNSVKNFVLQERRSITNFLLDGVEIDNTLGSLSRLSDQIWFPDALAEYRSGHCIELFKTFVIGRQFFDAERHLGPPGQHLEHHLSLVLLGLLFLCPFGLSCHTTAALIHHKAFPCYFASETLLVDVFSVDL